jgi:hypothetical protein
LELVEQVKQMVIHQYFHQLHQRVEDQHQEHQEIQVVQEVEDLFQIQVEQEILRQLVRHKEIMEEQEQMHLDMRLLEEAEVEQEQ